MVADYVHHVHSTRWYSQAVITVGQLSSLGVASTVGVGFGPTLHCGHSGQT